MCVCVYAHVCVVCACRVKVCVYMSNVPKCWSRWPMLLFRIYRALFGHMRLFSGGVGFISACVCRAFSGLVELFSGLFVLFFGYIGARYVCVCVCVCVCVYVCVCVCHVRALCAGGSVRVDGGEDGEDV